MADASTLTLEPDDGPVLRALRRLKGRATVGDVSVATGLAQAEAEASLRRLLERRQGHLEVGERGDLVYQFEPGLLERGRESLWTRIKRGAWGAFKVAFKVWIVAMLLIYLAVFVALLLAALFANRDGDGGGLGGGSERGGRGGGHVRFPMGDMLFWYWIWSPGWRRRPYYGEGYGGLGGRDRGKRRQGPPFYKKVFAFVFGPDEPEITQAQRDRDLLRFVRARKGVVTAAELVQHTGMGLDEAESELARLMAAHEGDVTVSDDGTLLYLFPGLMVSAQGAVEVREPAPAWRRLEPARPLTGNSKGTNTLIAGINGFNLVAAATAPLFIFPRLGLGGIAAEVALIWVPVAFSAVFFSVPLARWFGVAKENARRAARNVRKVLVGLMSKVSLGSGEPEALADTEAEARVREALSDRAHARVSTQEQLDRLVAEFDGEVEPAGESTLRYRFPAFRRQVEAAHGARRELLLEQREVGAIVYSSADDSIEESERDLETFDRALAEGSRETPGLDDGEDETPLALPPANDLTAYLNDPLRVGFRDERELAAMAAEVEARGRSRGAA